jgi:hypothetical protein
MLVSQLTKSMELEFPKFLQLVQMIKAVKQAALLLEDLQVSGSATANNVSAT